MVHLVGGSDNSNKQNSAAYITSLVVSVSGADHTVAFDENEQATINYLYGSAAPPDVEIKSISLSADATSDYDSGKTINVENDKVIITVTAQDGTTVQIHSITVAQGKPSLIHILDHHLTARRQYRLIF